MPIRCVVEQVNGAVSFDSGGGSAPCEVVAVEQDTFAILPVSTPLRDLVRTALARLGYSSSDAVCAKGSEGFVSLCVCFCLFVCLYVCLFGLFFPTPPPPPNILQSPFFSSFLFGGGGGRGEKAGRGGAKEDVCGGGGGGGWWWSVCV